MIINKLFQLIKRYSRIIFACYILILVFVIILKFPTGLVSNLVSRWIEGEPIVGSTPQLVPFRTIVLYVKQVQAVNDWFFKNLACNVIMFVPYGFLTPLFIKKSENLCIKVMVSGCLLSVFIEVFQYITALGLCDVDDVILNTVGAMLGFVIYKLLYLYVKKQ